MDALRESVRVAEAQLGSSVRAWEQVLAVVAHAHRLPGATPGPGLSLDVWREPGAAEQLGAVHESLVAGRGESGTFYTTPALVEWVLDQALDPLLVGGTVPRVLDPACGAGGFLLPVVHRIAERLDLAPSDVVGHVHGLDLDPVAVAITRLLLQIEAPRCDPALLVRTVRVGDGLGPVAGAAYDAVVGNPPFLGQLRTRTARDPVPGLGPYTDVSAVFLHRSLERVRAGGRVALVQPLSLLAARDAAPVRQAVVDSGTVTAFWSSSTPVFPGAAVLTCAPVVELGGRRRGLRQGDVATWHGPKYRRGPDVALPPAEWGPLAAPELGIPTVRLASAGLLGELGACTADFRDQYYGLVPFVRESSGAEGEVRLVTSGLIDPAECLWGGKPTRFAKTRYAAPVVDVEALHADGGLSSWARARLVPKVLVATQGRVIEAVVDTDGGWLPSVPVLTMTPRLDRLWHALAVLLAPPVVAHAAARYVGAALAPSAIKLSARQLAALPLPADRAAWDCGAGLARRAQKASAADRPDVLGECAEVMCRAYGDHAALEWWMARVMR